MSSASLMARAEEELRAARHLAGGGFAAQAVSRSYFAAFYAAEAALLELGETRSKHSGVVAAFVRLVTPEAGRDAGRLLRSLFDRRGQADYSPGAVPADEAERAIADAEHVVSAIAAWRGRRSAP
jgi:uncharacterized protein (UPF0332 family)